MDPSKDDNSKQPEKPAKGYGKRPVWFWVLVYVIAAVIIYGAVYLIFFHHKGSGGSGGFSY